MLDIVVPTVASSVQLELTERRVGRTMLLVWYRRGGALIVILWRKYQTRRCFEEFEAYHPQRPLGNLDNKMDRLDYCSRAASGSGDLERSMQHGGAGTRTLSVDNAADVVGDAVDDDNEVAAAVAAVEDAAYHTNRSSFQGKMSMNTPQNSGALFEEDAFPAAERGAFYATEAGGVCPIDLHGV